MTNFALAGILELYKNDLPFFLAVYIWNYQDVQIHPMADFILNYG